MFDQIYSFSCWESQIAKLHYPIPMHRAERFGKRQSLPSGIAYNKTQYLHFIRLGPAVNSHIDQVNGDIFDKKQRSDFQLFYIPLSAHCARARIAFAFCAHLNGPRFVVMNLFFSFSFNLLLRNVQQRGEQERRRHRQRCYSDWERTQRVKNSRIFCKTHQIEFDNIELCIVTQSEKQMHLSRSTNVSS